MEAIKNEYLFWAELEINDYNRHIETCKANGYETNKEKTDFVQKYATINAYTGKAEICHTKVDQLINESACSEEFNHIDYINEAWQSAGYETETTEYKQFLGKNVQRKTKKSVKEILSDFEALESTNSFVFGCQNDFMKLKNKYPLLYEAYKKLTKGEIKAANYEINKLEKLLILKNNKDAEIRVIKLLPHYFSVCERYTKENIKETLQGIYDEAGYQKKATAEQIHIWYEVKPCKVKNKANKYDNGFEILRMTFQVHAGTK